MIRYIAPLLAPAWSTVQTVTEEWRTLLALFPTITETIRTLPDHSTAEPPVADSEPYDPRTDPEVLANGMSLADARARARPAPDCRLPRSLVDWAKKAIRALQPTGPIRKPKEAAANS